jgi:hypothetical protein
LNTAVVEPRGALEDAAAVRGHLHALDTATASAVRVALDGHLIAVPGGLRDLRLDGHVVHTIVTRLRAFEPRREVLVVALLPVALAIFAVDGDGC